MNATPCPLCKSPSCDLLQTTVPLAESDPLVESTLARRGDVVRFWNCVGCGMIFRTPRPSPDQLNDYYERVLVAREPEILRKMGVSKETMEVRAKRRYAALYDQLSAAAPTATGHIVDVGGFDGGSLIPWQRAGWKTTLIDPSAKQRVLAHPAIQPVHAPRDLKERVDVVTSYHCAEHIEDLDAWANELAAMESNDALWVIEVPFDILYVRGLFEPQALPSPQIHEEHLNFFTERSLRFLARRIGIDVWSVEMVVTLYYFGPTISLRLLGRRRSSTPAIRPLVKHWRPLARARLRAHIAVARRAAGLRFRFYRLMNPDV